jgi:hypothetical protein
VTVRRLAVPIPDDASATQLAALGTLAAELGEGRWDALARSFTRLDQRGAVVPAAMAQMLADLAIAFRRAAASRDDREPVRL